jgi:hypothetical protein
MHPEDKAEIFATDCWGHSINVADPAAKTFVPLAPVRVQVSLGVSPTTVTLRGTRCAVCFIVLGGRAIESTAQPSALGPGILCSVRIGRHPFRRSELNVVIVAKGVAIVIIVAGQ